jgi:hypothetical protein
MRSPLIVSNAFTASSESFARFNDTHSCLTLTRFDHDFGGVQNGPEVGHFICISPVTFTPNLTGEMQICGY